MSARINLYVTFGLFLNLTDGIEEIYSKKKTGILFRKYSLYKEDNTEEIIQLVIKLCERARTVAGEAFKTWNYKPEKGFNQVYEECEKLKESKHSIHRDSEWYAIVVINKIIEYSHHITNDKRSGIMRAALTTAQAMLRLIKDDGISYRPFPNAFDIELTYNRIFNSVRKK
jgi:hypothetical protein